MDKKTPIIALWRYTLNERNYPGYHLTADSVGCSELLESISSITQGHSTQASFRLSPATQAMLNVPNNKRGEASCVYFDEFRVRRSTAGSETFHLSQADGICSLSASVGHLERLLDGIRDIARGRGDYSIGEQGGQSLWFWWFPANKTMEPTR